MPLCRKNTIESRGDALKKENTPLADRPLAQRWNGLHLVIQEGKGMGYNDQYCEKIPQERMKCPCRDGGVGEIG